ncbi:Hypothetical predicted protein [Octopus vulgaris]|uniref:Uncharacterized protein n=1 Tax=Octopus vulgaris TaxID=6645 RepID=A0AA36B021_OCTVU|nr:Hypothetical predicted protein [Octopus vulgaris]
MQFFIGSTATIAAVVVVAVIAASDNDSHIFYSNIPITRLTGRFRMFVIPIYIAIFKISTGLPGLKWVKHKIGHSLESNKCSMCGFATHCGIL